MVSADSAGISSGGHRPLDTVVHWSSSAAWEDDSLGWEYSGRVRTAFFDIGDPDGQQRPVVMLAEYPAGVTVATHWHSTDYVSIVVGGFLTVTGKGHLPGAVRRVAAGTAYGPIVAGPDGAA